MVSGDLVGCDAEERGQRARVAANHPGLGQLSDRVDLSYKLRRAMVRPSRDGELSSDPVYNDFFNSLGRELELKILGLVSPARSPGIPSIDITGCGDDSKGPCVTL